MTDQPQGQPQPQMLAAPPTQGVSGFAMALSANDVMLTFGHNRVTFTNATAPVPVVEWLMTLSMSPTTAAMLSKSLVDGLQQYEKLFGKIPTDPKQTMTLNVASPS